MYLDTVSNTSNGKVYRRYFLRTSYREDGKVKKKTVAYLKGISEEEAGAIRLALRYKDNLSVLGSIEESVTLHQGASVGAVWTLYEIARRVGVVKALGDSREGKLALWQVLARAMEQGSRLSAVRLAGRHAACDVLNLPSFNEDDLYVNLDWLCDHQAQIEDRLFKQQYPAEKPTLFLYDVTSTYLEGLCNELAAFGYNRDGKKGKLQLVLGLLCDQEGRPLSIAVFEGNTQGPKTFASQIRKVAQRFGGEGVTFVGDRGMIKSSQIEELDEKDFHYITAITKPQIEKLLSGGVLQMELFDDALCEVQQESVRYVLRRNPARAEEMAASRAGKQLRLEVLVKERNQYLTGHAGAKVSVAEKKVRAKIAQLKAGAWLGVEAEGRSLNLVVEEEAQQEEARLDGCYALKTDLPAETASKQVVHDRYKDLTAVEMAFRTSKTVHLEMRPVYVRTEDHTRGHVLVVMLAYLIRRELSRAWAGLNVTVEEGLAQLATLCSMEVKVEGGASCLRIPAPRDGSRALLKPLSVRLPETLPHLGTRVVTRKSLPSRRKRP